PREPQARVPTSHSDEDAEHDDLDALAKAVGLLVLQWGQAEQSLDLIVAALWNWGDGKRHAKRIPIMLERKLVFVRSCLAIGAAAPLFPFKPALDNLLGGFEALSVARHDLIHGAIQLAKLDNGALVFARLEVRDGAHHYREIRIDGAEY